MRPPRSYQWSLTPIWPLHLGLLQGLLPPHQPRVRLPLRLRRVPVLRVLRLLSIINMGALRPLLTTNMEALRPLTTNTAARRPPTISTHLPLRSILLPHRVRLCLTSRS
jgi:hypothetical protein